MALIAAFREAMTNAQAHLLDGERHHFRRLLECTPIGSRRKGRSMELDIKQNPIAADHDLPLLRRTVEKTEAMMNKRAKSKYPLQLKGSL